MAAYEQRLRDCGIRVPDILLPKANIDLRKWAVVACDQFTAEPAYWQRVAETVGDAPSAYRLIFPETYLAQGMGRVKDIHRAMRDYQTQGVLETASHGFVLLERGTSAGNRLGLVMAVDLERYDFSPDACSLIRPTEGTILARIPPRVQIREGAPIEASHVMLLADDPMRTVVEPLYAAREQLRPLYDFELMQGGGHVRGWAVETPEALDQLADALEALRAAGDGLLFAVGDGNHSLATARQCWLNLRGTLTEAQRAEHPARFAMVELVNLHDDAMRFEPIHRVLFHADPEELGAAWASYAQAHGLGLMYEAPSPGEQGGVFVSAAGSLPWKLSTPKAALAVASVQDFLDGFVASHPVAEIDYIHGEDSLRALCAAPRTGGVLLPALDKAALFPAVRAGGVLPRKTFSMGEAQDKRYYLECRAIV